MGKKKGIENSDIYFLKRIKRNPNATETGLKKNEKGENAKQVDISSAKNDWAEERILFYMAVYM